ncbi:MAG: hypothetical protein MI810_11320 [Flavobacteriales bacterium]|jgi:hypothetical protein|nr:hypothetical protein [Flavobacteriales bacterium]
MDVYYLVWEILIALFILILVYGLLAVIEKKRRGYHESDDEKQSENDNNSVDLPQS